MATLRLEATAPHHRSASQRTPSHRGLGGTHASANEVFVERLELKIPLKRSGSLGFGSSHLGPDRGRESRAQAILTETIEVETLDGFAEARGLGSLCFIKADIEGWELNMLQGATKVLSAFRPVLLLEIDDAHLKRAGQSKVALFAFLGEHGYGWRRIEGYEGKSQGQIHLPASRRGLQEAAGGHTDREFRYALSRTDHTKPGGLPGDLRRSPAEDPAGPAPGLV